MGEFGNTRKLDRHSGWVSGSTGPAEKLGYRGKLHQVLAIPGKKCFLISDSTQDIWKEHKNTFQSCFWVETNHSTRSLSWIYSVFLTRKEVLSAIKAWRVILSNKENLSEEWQKSRHQIRTKCVAYFYPKKYTLLIIKKIIILFFTFMFSHFLVWEFSSNCEFTVTRKFLVSSNRWKERLKRNFYSLGYYCTPNLSIFSKSIDNKFISSIINNWNRISNCGKIRFVHLIAL